jgi:hypothetical protein
MIYLFATRQKVARFKSGVHLARSFDWIYEHRTLHVGAAEGCDLLILLF